MTDTISAQRRSEVMRAVRSNDTKIEVLFRKKLWAKGKRYRKNCRNVIGKPDIAFPGKKIAIFIDSCFWHGCPYHCRMPNSNKSYWIEKIKRNKERDKKVTRQLKKSGWKVLRFWEHSIQRDLSGCLKKVYSVFSAK